MDVPRQGISHVWKFSDKFSNVEVLRCGSSPTRKFFKDGSSPTRKSSNMEVLRKGSSKISKFFDMEVLRYGSSPIWNFSDISSPTRKFSAMEVLQQGRSFRKVHRTVSLIIHTALPASCLIQFPGEVPRIRL